MPGEREVAQALLSSYEPSLRDRVGNAIYDVARSLGMSSTANRMRNEGTAVMDFIPGVGEVLGVNDAMNDFNAGNYGMAAAGLGLTAAGVVPGVGDAVANAGRKGIRAFHGSPHDFDRFDMSKIGTGEGAQAYGHGIYFAEAEDVAKSYRDMLSSSTETPERLAKEWLEEVGDPVAAADEIAAAARRFKSPQIVEKYRDAEALLRGGSFDPSKVSSNGHMYEVRINADPEDFLDWDMPLVAQPQNVLRAIRAENPTAPGMARGHELYEAIAKTRTPRETGKVRLGAAETSARLREAGIPGIRYLDQGSRGAGDGTRNYVVFDDSLIEIVKKYGLAGAVAAGLISQEMAAQMQAQGMGEI